jgi:endoglucanase
MRIGKPQLKLLEQLCNACGVSGAEGEVRSIVLEQLKPKLGKSPLWAKNPTIDVMGNLIAHIPAKEEPSLRVMLAAHMDEVGFMLTKDENDGFFRFDVVGGIDKRLLVGKAVWVGKDHIAGVIGAKPIHLASEEELKHSIAVEDLRIDVSPENKTKVNVGIEQHLQHLSQLGETCGRSLRYRLGVATLIQLLGQSYPHLISLEHFLYKKKLGCAVGCSGIRLQSASSYCAGLYSSLRSSSLGS